MGAHGGLLLLASPSDADANAVLADSLRGHDVCKVSWLGGEGSIPSYVRTQIRDAIGEAR